jgi:heme a synthase
MIAAKPLPGAALRHSLLERYAWAVVAYNVFVILWGAFVRATGSGAGCGDHWPLCNGQVTPRSPSLETIVEFTHRATSGVDVILVAALLVWVFRALSKGHPARMGAVLSTVFLVTEALIGAGLVLLQRVVKNASGYWSTAHQLNTLTLLACLALTAWWIGGRRRLRFEGPPFRMAAVSLGAVALLAVSGVIAALGNTLFPAASLSEGFAQDLDPASSIFLRLRILHPAIALCTAVWLLYVATTRPSRRAWTMVAILIAQLALGLANLLLLAPVWTQILHLLLADLLWISLILFCAEMLEEPA